MQTDELQQLVFTPEQLKEATPDELEYILKLQRAQQALKSPLDYACYVTPTMKRFEFLEYINEVLVALVEKRLYKSGPGPASVRLYKSRLENGGRKDRKGRLVHPETGAPVIHNLGVNVPSQHGKSMLISEHFIPWVMTVYPDESVIHTTYSGKFAAKWGRLGRQHINEHPELGLKLADDKQSTTDWGIDGHRGSVIFRGTGGSITGEGGNVVIDDPVSGDEEASNPDRMESLWDWYNGTMKSRIHPEKFQILIQTRWAFNDPTGKFRESDPDKWFWVILPALAYDDVNEDGISIDVENGNKPDPLGRRPGDPLCPERFDVEDYENKRNGNVWFEATYQCRPGSSATEMFPEFNHYKLDNGIYTLYLDGGKTELVGEARCYRFATMDLAATEKKSSDYTVFMVWDVTPSRKMIVRHVERVQIKSSDHKKKTYEWAAKWNVRWVGIESSTYGITLLQHMIAEGQLQVRKLVADKDKYSRALVAAEMMANGQIFSALDAPWTDDFELELKRFGKQMKDDQVDCVAYGALQLPSIPSVWEKAVAVVKAAVGRVARRPEKKRKQDDHENLGTWY